MQKEQERTCRSKLRGRETCLTSFVYGSGQQPQQKVFRREYTSKQKLEGHPILFSSVQLLSCI